MATLKYLTIDDVLPGATYDASGNGSIVVPLAAINGFTAAEAEADVDGVPNSDVGDGRKLAYGLLDAIATNYNVVKNAYAAILASATAWANSTDYTAGDYITSGSVLYKALQTHTSNTTGAFNASATQGGNPIWEIPDVQQEPSNIVPTIGNASMKTSEGFTTTIEQKYTYNFKYSGTTDLADES